MTMTYKQVCNRLKDIEDDLERISKRADMRNGVLDEDEERTWSEFVDEHEELDKLRKSMEREADRLAVKQRNVAMTAKKTGHTARGTDEIDADPLGEPDSVEDRRFQDPWDVSTVRMGLGISARGAELRARALTAVERMQGTNDRRREVATRMIEEWDTESGKLSDQVLATSSPDYLRAFIKLARTNGRSEGLTIEERAAVDRAMSLTDSAGGYLVPFQLDPTVILTSDGSFNEIRRIARTVVATGDVWNGVSAGAVSWSFDAEAAAVSDDTPTFAQPSITVRTARGFVPISLEAYQDAGNVTQEVGRLLAQGKDDLEAVKFVTGVAGSNEPIGIVTALTGTSSVVNSTTTDTFAIGDVYKLLAALPARYRSRASWLANNLIYNLTRQFDTTGGSSMWAQLADDRPERLLGKPVYEAEAMDGVITALAANPVLIVGDFSNYVIADRVGMNVEFVPQLFDPSTGRPTGQKGWFAHYRVGADSVNDAAFRLLDVT